MHQQRVISMINQKKKVAMNCYTKALNENQPNTHRVQKCLQKLLRALHKDRHHTIQHYRHLLETSLDQVSEAIGFKLLLDTTLRPWELAVSSKIWRRSHAHLHYAHFFIQMYSLHYLQQTSTSTSVCLLISKKIESAANLVVAFLYCHT